MTRESSRDERPGSSSEDGSAAPTDRPVAERSAMRARTWAIAGRYDVPADYGIPELPEWKVSRNGERLSFVAEDGGEPFITAGNPVRARR